MSKTIKFELEFSGWQRARIDDDGAVIRPATAAQVVESLRAHLQQRFDECQENSKGKTRVTVKQIS